MLQVISLAVPHHSAQLARQSATLRLSFPLPRVVAHQCGPGSVNSGRRSKYGCFLCRFVVGAGCLQVYSRWWSEGVCFVDFLVGVSLAVWIIRGGQSSHSCVFFQTVNFVIDHQNSALAGSVDNSYSSESIIMLFMFFSSLLVRVGLVVLIAGGMWLNVVCTFVCGYWH